MERIKQPPTPNEHMNITNDQSLTGATHGGFPLHIYDDGFGPLFVYGNEFGPTAVIRAQTWEDAYSIAEDEFMDSATWEDVLLAYPEAEHDENCGYLEAFGHRPNGRNSLTDEGIYRKSDYEWLQPLTEAHEITLTITDPEPEPEPPFCGVGYAYRPTVAGRVVYYSHGRLYSQWTRVFLPKTRRRMLPSTLSRYWDNPECDVHNPDGPAVKLNPYSIGPIHANNP